MEILLQALIILRAVYLITALIGIIVTLFLKEGIEENHKDDIWGSTGGLIVWFIIMLIPIINTLFLAYVAFVLIMPEQEESDT